MGESLPVFGNLWQSRFRPGLTTKAMLEEVQPWRPPAGWQRLRAARQAPAAVPRPHRRQPLHPAPGAQSLRLLPPRSPIERGRTRVVILCWITCAQRAPSHSFRCRCAKWLSRCDFMLHAACDSGTSNPRVKATKALIEEKAQVRESR